jgi:hypothetical protein
MGSRRVRGSRLLNCVPIWESASMDVPLLPSSRLITEGRGAEVRGVAPANSPATSPPSHWLCDFSISGYVPGDRKTRPNDEG